MSNAPTIHGDRVWEAIEARHDEELRFRSAMITSTAMHTGLTLAMLLAPLLVPRPQLFQLTPVNMVRMQAPEPAPTPPAAEEEEAPEEQAAEPEPAEPEPPQPEDVPEDLEAQRRAEAEEAARQREEERRERERREEAERQRLAEEARRRREAEEAARRRAEEEARAQPQTASRRQAEPQNNVITQAAERGAVDMMFGEELSDTEVTLLDYWINRVLTNINRNWDPQVRPAGSREIVAVVTFRVDRGGRLIVGPDMRSGSGNRRYDDAAVSAVRAGQPFPPLPQAYRGNTLTINLAFRQD